MPVFRVEKNENFTIISNYHLRDKTLSLKAKGLLSLMLSLPEDWHYSLSGLAIICKESVDAVRGGIRELERAGYVLRSQERDREGHMRSMEYVIYEQPVREEPAGEEPVLENPVLENPTLENPTQLSTDRPKKDLQSTDVSIPFPQTPGAEVMGMEEREKQRRLVLLNIDYHILTADRDINRERLDELVELLVDTVCTNRSIVRIAGDDYPAEAVRARLLKLDSEHIRFVLEAMESNTARVRNIKKYLLAALYNAPATISSYYQARVNADFYNSE